MYRGTTPTLTWTITSQSFNIDDISQIWLTFKAKNTILTKELSELKLDTERETISYTLTQKETLKFCADSVSVQLRILLKNNLAFATPIQEIEINDILQGGVIHNV